MKKLLFPLLCIVAFASGFLLTSCLKEQPAATVNDATSATEQVLDRTGGTPEGPCNTPCTTGCTYTIKVLSATPSNVGYTFLASRTVNESCVCGSSFTQADFQNGTSQPIKVAHNSTLRFNLNFVPPMPGTPAPSGTITIRLTRSDNTFVDLTIPSGIYYYLHNNECLLAPLPKKRE